MGLTFLIVHYSPQLLDRVQPDSSSYLNPSPFRQILYNLLYVSLQKINIDIIFFQEFLMSLSIVCLFYFLKKKKISKVLLVLFYLLLTLNFYYTSFSKTILTESIFFSLINFAFILLFNLQNKYILLTFGLICGMIVSLKPVGIVFIFIFFVFSFFFTRSYKKLIQILILAILPLILENIVFYNKFDERKNIVSFSVVGKLFLLSGKDSFDVRQYPEKYHKLLNLTKKKFEPIHSYLEKIDNVLLRFELLSDYEAVAQYRILKYDVKNLDLDHKEILRDKNHLFIK